MPASRSWVAARAAAAAASAVASGDTSASGGEELLSAGTMHGLFSAANTSHIGGPFNFSSIARMRRAEASSPRHIAAPWFSDIGVLFFRRDLLERHSSQPGVRLPPYESYEQLMNAAAAVQLAESLPSGTGSSRPASGQAPTTAHPAGHHGLSGLLFSAAVSESLTSFTVELMNAHGASPLIEPKTQRSAISSPRNTLALYQALSFLQRAPSHEAAVASITSSLSSDDENAVAKFRGCRSVFLRSWPSQYRKLRSGMMRCNNLSDTADVGVTALPGGGSIGGWGWAISKDAVDLRACREAVKFLSSPDLLRDRAERLSFIPPRVSVGREICARQAADAGPTCSNAAAGDQTSVFETGDMDSAHPDLGPGFSLLPGNPPPFAFCEILGLSPNSPGLATDPAASNAPARPKHTLGSGIRSVVLDAAAAVAAHWKQARSAVHSLAPSPAAPLFAPDTTVSLADLDLSFHAAGGHFPLVRPYQPAGYQPGLASSGAITSSAGGTHNRSAPAPAPAPAPVPASSGGPDTTPPELAPHPEPAAPLVNSSNQSPAPHIIIPDAAAEGFSLPETGPYQFRSVVRPFALSNTSYREVSHLVSVWFYRQLSRSSDLPPLPDSLAETPATGVFDLSSLSGPSAAAARRLSLSLSELETDINSLLHGASYGDFCGMKSGISIPCRTSLFCLGNACRSFFLIAFFISIPFVALLGGVMFLVFSDRRPEAVNSWKVWNAYSLSWSDLSLDSEPLGRGHFGIVYRGRYRGTEVAVKRLLSSNEIMESSTALREFKDEARILGSLRHPNIILFMGACFEPGNYALVTEYMPLGTLYRVLHNGDVRLDWSLRMRMLRDICCGMAFLHSSKPPILHRDLKSPNILVDKEFRLKVADFGLTVLKNTDTEDVKKKARRSRRRKHSGLLERSMSYINGFRTDIRRAFTEPPSQHPPHFYQQHPPGHGPPGAPDPSHSQSRVRSFLSSASGMASYFGRSLGRLTAYQLLSLGRVIGEAAAHPADGHHGGYQSDPYLSDFDESDTGAGARRDYAWASHVAHSLGGRITRLGRSLSMSLGDAAQADDSLAGGGTRFHTTGNAHFSDDFYGDDEDDYDSDYDDDGLMSDNQPMFQGTLFWTAPEVLQQHPYTEACDVYSFAIICWEVMTREQLYPDQHPMSVGYRVLMEDMRPPIPEAFPEHLASTITTCWSKDPEERTPFKDLLPMFENLASPHLSDFINRLGEFRALNRFDDGHVDLSALLDSISPEIAPPDGDRVVFTHTDVERWTHMWNCSPTAMASAMRGYHLLLRQLLRGSGGFEVSIDGRICVAAFRDVSKAVYFGLKLQHMLLEHQWPAEIEDLCPRVVAPGPNGRVLFAGFRTRMAIHIGKPTLGSHPITHRVTYTGPTLNHVYMLSSTAKGGQILLSREASRQFQEVLDASEWPFADITPKLEYAGEVKLHKEFFECMHVVSDALRERVFDNRADAVLSGGGVSGVSSTPSSSGGALSGGSGGGGGGGDDSEMSVFGSYMESHRWHIPPGEIEFDQPSSSVLMSQSSGNLLDLPSTASAAPSRTSRIAYCSEGEVFRGTWRNMPIAAKRLELRRIRSGAPFSSIAHSVSSSPSSSFPDSASHPTMRRRAGAALGTRAAHHALLELSTELSTVLSLRHPNLLLYMGAGADDRHIYLVSELMERGNLLDLIRRNVNLEMGFRLRIILDVANAFNYLHQFQPSIVHGRFKTPNVLIGNSWQIKISGYGMDRIFGRPDSVSVVDYWASPEVLRGSPADVKSDVFSFGLMMFEALTMSQAFIDQRKDIKWINDVVENNLRPVIPSTLAPFERLLTECWHRDPELRPSFVQITRSLRTICDQQEARAPNGRRAVVDRPSFGGDLSPGAGPLGAFPEARTSAGGQLSHQQHPHGGPSQRQRPSLPVPPGRQSSRTGGGAHGPRSPSAGPPSRTPSSSGGGSALRDPLAAGSRADAGPGAHEAAGPTAAHHPKRSSRDDTTRSSQSDMHHTHVTGAHLYHQLLSRTRSANLTRTNSMPNIYRPGGGSALSSPIPSPAVPSSPAERSPAPSPSPPPEAASLAAGSSDATPVHGTRFSAYLDSDDAPPAAAVSAAAAAAGPPSRRAGHTAAHAGEEQAHAGGDSPGLSSPPAASVSPLLGHMNPDFSLEASMPPLAGRSISSSSSSSSISASASPSPCAATAPPAVGSVVASAAEPPGQLPDPAAPASASPTSTTAGGGRSAAPRMVVNTAAPAGSGLALLQVAASGQSAEAGEASPSHAPAPSPDMLLDGPAASEDPVPGAAPAGTPSPTAAAPAAAAAVAMPASVAVIAPASPPPAAPLVKTGPTGTSSLPPLPRPGPGPGPGAIGVPSIASSGGGPARRALFAARPHVASTLSQVSFPSDESSCENLGVYSSDLLAFDTSLEAEDLLLSSGSPPEEKAPVAVESPASPVELAQD
ncbi:TKL/DRK protein kinase [Fonticula alba]|uniref:TKL/DRK protein kinase n=1 Tax=Fonticula alba TaxID=691883 RepID=A0A058Z9E5_FONAL|nr:TKL/DRK protein kinase [Fonticula alba]KCV70895.1 TKL/DRK protein kinase [Fonticula alba]|eukprot:XP_009494018.1 TKL/DRK protein kinase [Fonticula alba]